MITSHCARNLVHIVRCLQAYHVCMVVVLRPLIAPDVISEPVGIGRLYGGRCKSGKNMFHP